jgi:hypothetical protein
VRSAARLAAAVAALALAATTLAPAAASPRAAQPVPEADAVRVDLRSMTPFLVPGEVETLSVVATVQNTGQEPLRRLRMSLRFGDPLRGRSDIANGQPLARLGTRVADAPLGEGELAPAGTTEARFDVEVGDLPFRNSPRQAVYPLRVEIRARGVVLGAADTYVMWWPARGAPRVRLAWVWPLVEPGHRALGDDFFDDEALGDSIEDGRLVTLLRVGSTARIPLTWAVDPALLDALRRMANGYTVGGREGRRGASAKAFLERLRGLRDAHVLPLPYADPDLTLTADDGEAQEAYAVGAAILTRELGVTGDARLAWPPGGTLSPGVASHLAGRGVKGLVVPEEALPLAESLYYTPTAATTLESGVVDTTALVVDGQLSSVLRREARDVQLDVQRFLADSAMVSLERPNDVRDVVVAPPRAWDPLAPFATQLLTRTREAPWLEPVTLADVLAGRRSDAARTLTPPGPQVVPPALGERVAAARASVARLSSFLAIESGRADQRIDDLDDALLRALSSQGGGDRLVTAVNDAVKAQFAKVRIVPGGVITMTGRSGRIPLTFQNDLGQTVNVAVRLDTKNRLALKDDAQWRRGKVIAVPPGGSTRVIEGKATTGGLFPIKVELLADGAPIGDAIDLRVRSTAWGAVALGVTGVAFGLLLVGSATRLVRRRRGAKAA